jgi:hypothetical protein
MRDAESSGLFWRDLGLTVAASGGVLVGALLAEGLRTRVWTLQTPHSREALFTISVLAACAYGTITLLSAGIALLLKRGQAPSVRTTRRQVFLLSIAIGILAAALGRSAGPFGVAIAWACLLLAPALVVSSPRFMRQ